MSDSEDDTPLVNRPSFNGRVEFVKEIYTGLTPWEISEAKAAASMATAEERGEVIHLSDDEDEEDVPLSRRSKAAAPKPAKHEVDSEDEDEDDRPLSKRPRQGKSGVAAMTAASSSASAAAALPEPSMPKNVSDSEEDVPLSQRPRAAATSSAGKAKVTREANDSAKRRGSANEAAAAASSDDDEEEDADDGMHNIAVEMAREVLARGERGDHEGVLSVLGVPLTRNSPFSSLRTAYLGLARLIHPDKMVGAFPGATQAFQSLASAFEALTAPAYDTGAASGTGQSTGNAKGKRPTPPTVGRSNDGCYRTRCSCPRCGGGWGGRDSGLPEYEYTFMMQGLKTYHCAGCLFEFGCMTATHHCPFCRSAVPYHPRDYHRRVECPSCERSFGFKLYTVGPRVEAALREHLREQQAKRRQQRGSTASRNERRSVIPLSESQQRLQGERLYVLGLLNACPRCGHADASSIPDSRRGEASRRAHLRACNDVAAHAAHAQGLAAEEGRRAAIASGQGAQEDAGSLAAWQFLGGSAGSAWMLTDRQLDAQCTAIGMSAGGDRSERLARLASHECRALQGCDEGDGGGGWSSSSTALMPSDLAEEQRQRQRAQASSTLPDNLHALPLLALRELCAGLGLTPPEGSSTDDLIHILEGRRGTDEVSGHTSASEGPNTV